MTLAVFLTLVVLAGGGYWWWRGRNRLLRVSRALQEAWREVEAARRLRHQALESFLRELTILSLVPQAQPRLAEALNASRVAAGPRAMAEADRHLRGALAVAYRGLPCQRPDSLRQAQNTLAEAEDELDLARRRYNELVHLWQGLLSRRSYSYLARRLAVREWDFYLSPGEELKGPPNSWG